MGGNSNIASRVQARSTSVSCGKANWRRRSADAEGSGSRRRGRRARLARCEYGARGGEGGRRTRCVPGGGGRGQICENAQRFGLGGVEGKRREARKVGAERVDEH